MAMSCGLWHSWPAGAGAVLRLADGAGLADAARLAGGAGLAGDVLAEVVPAGPVTGEADWLDPDAGEPDAPEPAGTGGAVGASFAQPATTTVAPSGSALPPMPLRSTK
jgi:hypothetical protein